MADIIKLLPDSIANQIAAGEVVQRPASVVKELLENALDAGATRIQLLISEGGQNSIQVIDNGKGMSETDARMCWERHATSKITQTSDLFALQTFGFRGEALASIAAVARVELKTKRAEDSLGTKIVVEGSEVKVHEPVACADGTIITVKNLFFNTPARRNFLKSNSVETRHIFEEFHRVALANYSLSFELYNDEKEVYKLVPHSLRERISSLFGKVKEKDLLPCGEKTDIVDIEGYIGVPSVAKRVRGEQYFFANGRYVRDPYLRHAISSAYEGLIEKDKHPLFVLFLTLDPAKIDVNVHPTKTEVKFEEGKALYAIIRSVVKKALGGFMEDLSDDSLNPFSFSQNPGTHIPSSPDPKPNPGYNPFGQSALPREQSKWERLYQNEDLSNLDRQTEPLVANLFDDHIPSVTIEECFQIVGSGYLVAQVDKQMLVVDQQAASERINYQKFLKAKQRQKAAVQHLLFPRTLEFSDKNCQILLEILPKLNAMGFDVSQFGKNTFIVNGIPAETKLDPQTLIEGVLETYLYNQNELKLKGEESLLRALSKNTSIKTTVLLKKEEISKLIENLLCCDENRFAPDGKTIFVKLNGTELDSLFNKKSKINR